jgi:hypothetical protein
MLQLLSQSNEAAAITATGNKANSNNSNSNKFTHMNEHQPSGSARRRCRHVHQTPPTDRRQMPELKRRPFTAANGALLYRDP